MRFLLYGLYIWSVALLRVALRRTAKTGGGSWVTGGTGLKGSQAYPTRLGTAMAKLFVENRPALVIESAAEARGREWLL